MTAYLQRLLDSGGLPVSVAPVPQSSSPVADADQRLLGAGPEAFGLPPAGADPVDMPDLAATALQTPAPPARRRSPTAPPPVASQDPALLPPATEKQTLPPRLPPQDVASPPAMPKAAPTNPPEHPPQALPHQASEPARTVEPNDRPRPTPAVSAPPPVHEATARETTDKAAPVTASDPRIEAPAPEAQPAIAREPAPQAVEPPPPKPQDAETAEAHPPRPVTPVEPLPPEAPPPPPPPAEYVVERQIERVVEREATRPEAEPEVSRDRETSVSTAPRTAAALSQIGPLPDRQRLRRIHGLRWR